jgi:hypothetical protein
MASDLAIAQAQITDARAITIDEEPSTHMPGVVEI